MSLRKDQVEKWLNGYLSAVKGSMRDFKFEKIGALL